MKLSSEPNVELDAHASLGTYRGWSSVNASHWTAIPYAEPPRDVSDNFSPPRPAQPFTEIRECVPKKNDGRNTLSITAPSGPMDSDAQRPVIVFVHGGRYQYGNADGPWYRGDAFAQSGCIVVSVNYRFRFEGFLPLDGEPVPSDFDAHSEPPYFRAVEDLLTALRWVRDNISAFGGDPTNVTAMGQSAGGALVTYTMGSPRSHGLVQRCVILSHGFPRIPWTVRTRMAKWLLRGPLSFNHVSNLPQAHIDRAFDRYVKRYFNDCAVGLFPHSPENMPEIPLLIGTLRDEFVKMKPASLLDGLYRSSNPLKHRVARSLIIKFSRSIGAPGVASKNNMRAWLDYCDSVEPPQPMGRAIGDAAIRQFNVATMEAHATKAPTWVYEFHGGEGNALARGTSAQHCADIPLAFHCLDVEPESVERFCGPNAQERLQPLADRFHGLIVDFAHGKEPNWPQFHPASGRQTRLFDMNTCEEEVVEDAHAPVRRFFPNTHGS